MSVGFSLRGHSELCDGSGTKPCRRFTARRQGIPLSPLDVISRNQEYFTDLVALSSERWLLLRGHSELRDGSGAEPFRRASAQRQSIHLANVGTMDGYKEQDGYKS